MEIALSHRSVIIVYHRRHHMLVLLYEHLENLRQTNHSSFLTKELCA